MTLNYIGDTLNFSAIQNNDELAKFRPQKLNEYQDRFFGSIYVTSLAALEQVFQIRGNQEIYFFRHLITFLISIAGIFAMNFQATTGVVNYMVNHLISLSGLV